MADPNEFSCTKQALHLRENVLGAQHPQTASNLHHLGQLYLKQGDYLQPEACLQQALDIYEKQSGIQHPEVIITLNYLGHLYEEQGKYEQAECYYQQALTIQEERLRRVPVLTSVLETVSKAHPTSSVTWL